MSQRLKEEAMKLHPELFDDTFMLEYHRATGVPNFAHDPDYEKWSEEYDKVMNETTKGYCDE